MSTLTTFIQHSFASPRHSNQRRKRNKGIQIGKEEIKPSLFADDMILYIKNPRDTTRKLLQLINGFGKAGGYKINTKNSLTNNERPEREIKGKKNPIYHCIKENKIPRNTRLPKKTKDLYSENYKTLMKESEDHTNR